MSRDDHDIVWELIPWYITKTLPPNEAELVRRHLQTCSTCRLELARQQDLAQWIASRNPFEPIPSHRLSSPSARPRNRQRHKVHRLPKHQCGKTRYRGRILSGAIVAASLLIVAFLDPPENDFHTLTDPSLDAGAVIRFQPAPGIPLARLEAILTARGLTLVNGSSGSGVYTAIAREDVDLGSTAKTLMAGPEILFAAPGIPP
ncbi:anti-sigma factor family protein [Rhodospirillum sp. A1_3_36]|uniref:anti-sigma factor family protein n=1 Tax=Rhodospirillum sp. A1_3_36 TaxID=3391666 RepID=UPI0039A6CE9A